MTSSDAVEWAVRALSFFNTIALLWMGLTVLLNAERRTWGTYAAGGGLTLAGLFFAGHSAVVGRPVGTFDAELDFWWRIGWLPFIIAPFLWYLVMAWYSGCLQAGRHRPAQYVVAIWGIVALSLLATASPLPSFGQILKGGSAGLFATKNLPLLILIYPGYSVLCILLSLVALRQPIASERFMGDVARRRALPWLVAASLTLLGISFVAGGATIWFLNGVQSRRLDVFSPATLASVLRFDILISALVAAAVVLMGRAVVSYEVFTGKTLPRRGLFRHWRSSLILAAGYGALIGGSLDLPVDPIYRLLLATILMTLFYALVSWRSYVERERSMARLRPFVASQQLYEQILSPSPPVDADAVDPFQALCGDVLGARVGYLAALGPLSPLVGTTLAYPPEVIPPSLAGLASLLHSPQTLCVPLDPEPYGGAIWAVPLWRERGLIGVLLLGEKRDGGLFTQEEIEIARATGERLIDTQASAEMARRLMALQRQQLAESQVIDRRARRMLHDDVLPRLHTAMLTLSHRSSNRGEPATDTIALLADAHRQIADLLKEMPIAVMPTVARWGVLGALQRAIEDELALDFDGVTWQIEPTARRLAESLPATTAEVLFYAAREAAGNAARYGRGGDPTRPLHLAIAVTWRDGLAIAIEDDGVGLGVGSATGSGQGLALHSTMMAVIGGTLTVESTPGAPTRVVLSLPDGGTALNSAVCLSDRRLEEPEAMLPLDDA